MRGDKQLRVGMMVRGYVPVPRPSDLIYAPIDLAVAIAEGLAARGHAIDLYAPAGSQVRGVTIESLGLPPLVRSEADFRSLISDPGQRGHVQPAAWDMMMAREMFRRTAAGDYDLLFFMHQEMVLPFASSNPRTPVVYTLHDPISPWLKELLELNRSPNQHFISISNNQRRDAPDLPYVRTIYNGIDLNLFSFSAEAEDYLLIVGRVVPEKGFKEAVELAVATGERLLMIGPVYPDHQPYFDQYIKPYLNDRILYLGAMEQPQVVKYYQKAKALLTPVQWEEPFGLASIEAMACGTPVISLRRGAAVEIIKHRKYGFLVGSMADMAAAVKKVHTIDRAACRRYVEEHFSQDRMVDEYEAVFQRLATRNALGRLQRKVAGTVQKSVKKTADVARKTRRAI